MIYTAANFDYSVISNAAVEKLAPGRKPKNLKRRYIEVFGTFDIETTNIPEIEQTVMYVWQLCIDGLLIIGRTWPEFSDALHRINDALPKDAHFVCYIHNAAYEFQFLRNIAMFEEADVFAVKSRRPVRFDIGNVEFRCSYFLTNMSLREFLRKMQVPVQKTELDYKKRRYPWTQLTESELEYAAADVVGLWQALKKLMQVDGDTLTTIPISSTGYVRRDFKRAMHSYTKYLRVIQPDYDLYVALRRAFRGGNTHANKFYAGVILPDVSSYDRASSYPDVIVNMPFPVKKFQRRDITTIDALPGKTPYVARVEFMHFELKDLMYPCPYVSSHKCTGLVDSWQDNGRVMQAAALTMYVTDIDMEIIKSQYKWSSAVVVDCWCSEYGVLPDGMIETTMDYYRRKTELKNNIEADPDGVFYMKSKNKLNSIYGMTATNPVRTPCLFNGTDFAPPPPEHPKFKTEMELLEIGQRKPFCAYQWGAWVTAWARYWLQRAIDLCGAQFVYADTDSVYFVGDVDFTALNDEIRATAVRNGAYADDINGERHYLGVYEFDKHCKQFVTLGAKKYAYIGDDDKLHITVSGVNKKLGAEELGDIANLRDGFVFRDAAGLDIKYNDEPYGVYHVDGRELPIGINAYLYDSTYTVGVTDDYRAIMQADAETLDNMRKQW